MAIHGYHRTSQDNLITLKKRLHEEAPWAEIDITPYLQAADQLNIPVLPLLKLRLSHGSEALSVAVSTPSDGLTQIDFRWDAAQRRYLRRIEDAEESDDPAAQAAGRRLRAATTLGDGLGQTLLSLKEERDFGEKQVALARGTMASDIALIGAGAAIEEIALRTADLKAALEKVPEGAGTSRFARIRTATSALVELLNTAHNELEAQIAAATAPETRDRLAKLLASLQALLPEK